jgi:hypothetical protein
MHQGAYVGSGVQEGVVVSRRIAGCDVMGRYMYPTVKFNSPVTEFSLLLNVGDMYFWLTKIYSSAKPVERAAQKD